MGDIIKTGRRSGDYCNAENTGYYYPANIDTDSSAYTYESFSDEEDAVREYGCVDERIL